MDGENQQLQQVVESSGSSVIIDPPHSESDQAGELNRQVEAKQKKRAKWRQKWDAMPKKKRRMITMIIVGATVRVVGGTALIMSITALNIDYGISYRVAKELRIKIQKMRSEYECQKVLDYVDSAYTTMGAFNEYVEGCRTVGDDSTSLVEELGLTDAVRRDDEVALRYDVFKGAYEAAVSGGEDLNATLELYTIWHNWIIASAGMGNGKWDIPDSDLQAAANILINSGDEALKSYGEGWLSRLQEAAQAYRDYYVAGYDAENKEQLRVDMEDKKKGFTEYEAQKRPNIKELKVLETADTAKLYTRFEDMYDYIRRAYQEHYQKGSNDCKELLTEVVCD